MVVSSSMNESVVLSRRENNQMVRGLNGTSSTNDASFEAEDSEAETERLHESPTKKRVSEEDAIGDGKRIKLADKEPNPSHKSSDQAIPNDEIESKGQETPPEPAAPESMKLSGGEENETSSAAEAPGNGSGNESGVEDGEEENDDEEDEEDEEDTQASDRETNEERLKALKALTDIEVEFAQVRDSLHDQQIAKFDLEIMMCSEGSHPELEQCNMQLTEDHNARLQRTRSLLSYQMNAIFTQSRANRCSVYQTYLKNKFALRSDLLNEVTRRWYQINYERLKETSNSPDYGYVASTKPYRIQRPTVQSLKITQHAGLLNMPLAPHMSQVTDTERESDLHDIGLR